ncbi:MAG: exo-alpha-sialidase [Marinoscillum sp.]
MNRKLAFYLLVLSAVILSSAFVGYRLDEMDNGSLSDMPIATIKSKENQSISNTTKSKTANVILQSNDAGKTWVDISDRLPDFESPEAFFASKSEIYLRLKNRMYRSKINLESPEWEEQALDPRLTSIAFNPSGTMAYNYQGQVYRKDQNTGTWDPIYTEFPVESVRTVFETINGAVLLGSDYGLFKSADNGWSWRKVLDEGWVMNMVESDGVLIGSGQGGIIRSTDNGEHWESVINDRGVGITVESIDGGFAAITCCYENISRRVRISLDKGKTWKIIDQGLPPSLSISSIKQSGGYLICGHPDGIYRSSDMGDTWNLVYSNYQYFMPTSEAVPSKVFKLYGNDQILYAVTVDAGC